MRILWFNHRDIRHPMAGGAERTIYEVGRRLVAGGCEMHLASVNLGNLFKEEILEDIIIHRSAGNIRAHLMVPAMITKVKPDVIIDDVAHAAPWLSSWFSDLPGTVFFHHLHARTLKGQVSRPMAAILAWMEKQYPRFYRSWPFVTESESSESDLENMGIESSRITRIPPGVDTDLFHPRPKTKKPTLVYFGGMRPYKRPEHALIVLKLLLKKGYDVTLTMVGDGPSFGFVNSFSRELNLDDHVIFTGKLDNDSLSETIAQSWVNIHCSLTEGWGFSTMEAAACGTPTVAYNVPGLSNSVIEDKTGMLADDGDATALSSKIEKIFNEGRQWTTSCRSFAEMYSWKNTATLWETHLKRVTSMF